MGVYCVYGKVCKRLLRAALKLVCDDENSGAVRSLLEALIKDAPVGLGDDELFTVWYIGCVYGLSSSCGTFEMRFESHVVLYSSGATLADLARFYDDAAHTAPPAPSICMWQQLQLTSGMSDSNDVLVVEAILLLLSKSGGGTAAAMGNLNTAGGGGMGPRLHFFQRVLHPWWPALNAHARW